MPIVLRDSLYHRPAGINVVKPGLTVSSCCTFLHVFLQSIIHGKIDIHTYSEGNFRRVRRIIGTEM